MRTLDSLLSQIDYKSEKTDSNLEITSLCYDSRKCSSDSLFFAIKGEKLNGHDFIQMAIDKGAVAVICEYIPDELQGRDFPFIIVKDTREALSSIAHHFYDYPSRKLKMIGVTGTNGKTTVTFILKSIFEAAGMKSGIIGTTGIYVGDEALNATHTTPESLELTELLHKMVKSNVEVVIMEVSSHALDQGRINGIMYDAAIFTNLTLDHLDYHRTMDAYAAAKSILFTKIRKGGYAVINGDDKYAKMIGSVSLAETIYVGRLQENDVVIADEKMDISGIKFTLGDNKYCTSLIGKFNIDNTALCVVVALKLNVSNSDIRKGLATTSGAPGRMQLIPLKNGAAGLVDYAHTPDALEKALLSAGDVLKSSKSGGRLICVFGCGGDRDKSKRPIMGRIASENADIAIVTNDNPRTENPEAIASDILKGIDEGHLVKVKTIIDRQKAIETAVSLSRENDLILVAGKGHENYQIIGTERLHFDDAEMLRSFG